MDRRAGDERGEVVGRQQNHTERLFRDQSLRLTAGDCRKKTVMQGSEARRYPRDLQLVAGPVDQEYGCRRLEEYFLTMNILEICEHFTTSS